MYPLPIFNNYQFMANLVSSLCLLTTAHTPLDDSEVELGHQLIVNVL